VVVWIYDGGEGSVTAAPVAKQILDFYFRRQMGLLETVVDEAGEAGEGETTTIPDAELPVPIEP